MLVIRLHRVGKKHQPSYRLVVAERRSKLGGPPAEDLGSYDPFAKTSAFKQERVRYWLGVGAKPTPTVHNLFVKLGVVNAPKMKIHVKKTETKPAAENAAAAAAPGAAVAGTAPAAESPAESAA